MAALFSVKSTLFICAIWCLLDVHIAINLDARFSVIKQGDSDTYFGYSVAQHQIVDENDPSTVEQNVFLIGSPKKKDTGGAVYRCNAATTGAKDCEEITDFLTSQSDGEELDDQWLGVSMASQGTGQKAVACAHRFLKDNKGLGICYVLTQSLRVQNRFQPCTKVSTNRFMQDFGLCQAGMSARIGQVCAHRYLKDNVALGRCFQFTQSLEVDVPFIPCKGMENKNYMKDFGLCQAGLAVTIGEDSSLLMGAPGSVFWRGSVFLANVSDELGVSAAEIVSPYEDPSKVSEGQQPTPTKSYTYQGYALTMGRFDKSKDLYYVSGAPKGGSIHGGSVVFYKMVRKIVGGRSERSLKYESEEILKGPVAFSGFGSSLLAVDLNSDGFDDLIVGAPYYYSKNRGGAIYVYLGGDEMINDKQEPTRVLSRKMGDVECKSLRCDHARFGMSLAKLGDINMDSYQDFAVGAPYEGNGAVYIYHGQQGGPGFNINFVQRIVASDLPEPFSNIHSFGHSMSGGMDMDQNGYPDLLVGGYESDTAVLIRSRPIIRLFSTTTIEPSRIDLEAKPSCKLPGVKDEYKDRMCVAVKVCVRFTTDPPESKNSKSRSSTPSIRIQKVPSVVYTLEAERSRRIARVELQNAMDANKKVVNGQKMQLKKDDEVCDTQIALIKSKFDDKLNPVEFTYTFNLTTDSLDPDTYPNSATQDINEFPILETEDATVKGHNDVAVTIDFKKECGSDQICDSNLKFDPTLAKVDVDSEGKYELLIQNQNEIRVNISLKNEGEAAYLTRVYIEKPFAITYLATHKDENSLVSCTEDETLIWCDQIGNPLRTEESVAFSVSLNVPKELAETDILYNITAWVNTSSAEATPDGDSKVMYLRVINRADIDLTASSAPDNSIRCEGEPRGASVMETEEDIGARVTHRYFVSNRGPGIISESYITIHWPYEVTGSDGRGGKYLLYLMRPPRISGPVLQCNDQEIKDYVNPHNIKEVTVSEPIAIQYPANATFDDTVTYKIGNKTTRRKRATAQAVKSTDKVAILSCKDGTAKCFQLKCKLGKLEPYSMVQIVMESRLWESTLLSDYRKAVDVQIISWGVITLPKDSKIQQDTGNDQSIAITRAIPDFKEVSGQNVKWWIILVAVVVGIILLLVVIFILYKVGFFRRKQSEEMKMYKAEKKQQAQLMSDYDDRDL